MWVFYALLPTLIVTLFVAGGIMLLVRRGSDGWSIQFSGVLLAYTATAMLVGVFLIAAGAGLLLKAGFAGSAGRDFSYSVQPYSVYPRSPAPGSSTSSAQNTQDIVDPSDAAIRDDVASGISLAFAGAVVFAVHAFGAVILRRRGAHGAQLVTRAYNLLGLAVATLGFIGTGAQGLNDVVRRYVVGGDTVQAWQIRHPGEPLAIAAVLFPLILWFGWRVWQEMGADRSRNEAPAAVRLGRSSRAVT
jgi:hypothetical protein